MYPLDQIRVAHALASSDLFTSNNKSIQTIVPKPCTTTFQCTCIENWTLYGATAVSEDNLKVTYFVA